MNVCFRRARRACAIAAHALDNPCITAMRSRAQSNQLTQAAARIRLGALRRRQTPFVSAKRCVHLPLHVLRVELFCCNAVPGDSYGMFFLISLSLDPAACACARFRFRPNGAQNEIAAHTYIHAYRHTDTQSLLEFELFLGIQTACDPTVSSFHKKPRTVKRDIFIVRDWNIGQSLTIIMKCFFDCAVAGTGSWRVHALSVSSQRRAK